MELNEDFDRAYLPEDLYVFWQCWCDLSATRNEGQQIPWIDLYHWALAHDMRDLETLKRVVWKMDQFFLSQQSTSPRKEAASAQEADALKRLKDKKRGK